ncbi:hypothetical protein BG004_006699 [Podila humilis]|nr:hypothetical protein BG004_006699 [Podila humilis]
MSDLRHGRPISFQSAPPLRSTSVSSATPTPTASFVPYAASSSFKHGALLEDRSLTQVPTRERLTVLGHNDVSKSPKGRRWNKAEMDFLVKWWTVPENYAMFKNPSAFKPGLTKNRIQQMLADDLNWNFERGYDRKQVKNKMANMVKLFNKASNMIGKTVNGNQPGHDKSLREKVIAMCPFFYEVENVWSADIRSDSMEPVMETNAAWTPVREEYATRDHASTENDDADSDIEIIADNKDVMPFGDAWMTSNPKQSRNDDILDKIMQASTLATATAWNLLEESRRQLAAEETLREKARLAFREKEVERDRRESRGRERTRRLRERLEYDLAKEREATRRAELRVREAEIRLETRQLEVRGRL